MPTHTSKEIAIFRIARDIGKLSPYQAEALVRRAAFLPEVDDPDMIAKSVIWTDMPGDSGDWFEADARVCKHFGVPHWHPL